MTAVAAVCLGLTAGVSTFTISQSEAVPGTGTLFGTDASRGNLITVDRATGAGTLVGPMGAGVIPALAVDPTTGVMYAGQGAGSPNVYTVDPNTGATTLVGNSGLGFAAIGAMDFNASGTLYAAVNIAGDGLTGSDHLATIDKGTGAASIIGSFGVCSGVTVPSSGGGSCTNEGMEAIAFDSTGALWSAHSTRGGAGVPGLYRIDATTGAATFVAPIDDGSGRPSGGVVSLQFDCNGALLGGSATAVGSAGDGGFLGTIDTVTGLWTFVGAVSATEGSSLGALSSQDPCAPQPGLHDARAIRLSAPHSVNLSGDGSDDGRVTVTVTNDSAHLETVGIYLDVLPPADGNCQPAGRLRQTSITLEPNGRRTLTIDGYPGDPTIGDGNVTFSCADPLMANDLNYTFFLVADVHADDLFACPPGALQSLSCFNALADDDADDTDNRRSRAGPIAQFR